MRMDAKYLNYVPQGDIYLFNTGKAQKAWLCYGCHYVPELNAHRFVLWAPNAKAVTLVGDFNGWDEGGSEVQLQQVCAHNWYVAEVLLSGGTKLRADNGWGVNWGASVNIGDQSHAVCVMNGDNMNVPEGKYSVYFNVITGKVIFRTVE